MKIITQYGLPFVEITLIHRNKSVRTCNFLLDTGSASTLISAELAIKLGLGPEPNDSIREIIGVGGREFVYEKHIDEIHVGTKSMLNFKVQIGDMDYGFNMDGIIGYNLLRNLKMHIDLNTLELY